MENITQENLENWLAGALEGGSNYWYLINDYDKSGFDKKLTTLENFVKSLINTPNYSIKIYDIETFFDDEDADPEESYLGALTLENILRGFNLMNENYKDMYERMISGDWDADDADVWFQLSVMGDIVYG